ncbi:metallophosphoesterase family protein [Lederbergia citrea]|uniref:Metallophosphoesterase family protein n=1 Tax=Lederbergia citrea TaxID=2833581 RepID=A0A942Z720_9BACI|nr:metallophosphoesterase family protein [Lederbergia citrea]MBS4224847.1 metallophosphoesterase family protein [Lederbergia citrea]
MKSRLQFREDHSFKIIQFTDLHVGPDIHHEKDARTFKLIDDTIRAEKPDLIVFTGDQIWSEGIDEPGITYRRILDHVSQYDLPFAVVFGNHDSEENITRLELHTIEKDYPMSLSESGPKEINGVGNYTLTIQSSESDHNEAILYFLDSGAFAPDSVGGYEWIHQDQVNWFVSESQKYEAIKNNPIPALAFIHIPLPEYKDLLQDGKFSGNKGEDVSSPKINSGLFTAMLEAKDVMGTFVGHDHDNDYCGKLYNISLCYGRVSGYHCYGDLQRGARIIQLYEGERRFDTWIRLDNGEKISYYSHSENKG